MSETTTETDYAGHTQGAVQSCHGSNYVDDATQQYTIARFVGNSREEERANAALFVAAADTETGYVATLAKLAAVEQERDDWERRAFAAGALDPALSALMAEARKSQAARRIPPTVLSAARRVARRRATQECPCVTPQGDSGRLR